MIKNVKVESNFLMISILNKLMIIDFRINTQEFKLILLKLVYLIKFY
jgi:hypothetical protein